MALQRFALLLALTLCSAAGGRMASGGRHPRAATAPSMPRLRGGHEEAASSAAAAAAAAAVDELSLTGNGGTPSTWDGEYESFMQHRLRVFDRVKAEREASKPKYHGQAITITLPDGSTKEGIAGVTTPHEIAMGISKRLADVCVAAMVDGGVMWDMTRHLEADCSLRLIKFDDEEGKHVFWHSSAHVLGQALEKTHGAYLVKGPAIDEGFFYDVYTGNDTISIASASSIETTVQGIVGESQPFERITLTKEEALEMFRYNPFKVEIISNKVPDGEMCTAYRCGPLIDLCRGPHLPTTGHVKAFSVTKNSAAVWKTETGSGDSTLQRVYGVSFPDKKALKEYKLRVEEAKKRDHREIGRRQDLFMFHPLSPGSAFFLPHGTRIYNKLQTLLRDEYRARGFHEVITPNIYNMQLWNRSGHAAHYRDNMFLFEEEEDKQVMGLKPMNCPGHCLVFGSKVRSYRDLPIRLADFGVLHRNEPTGSLTGLTRVRRFQQDDAHIFCRPEQVQSEISSCLDFISSVYDKVGLSFELLLSTRPTEDFIGSVDQWDHAEASLKSALDATGVGWQLRPGDGAFYGPKIDVLVLDALKRRHQCATIQLDFQLPQRFNLSFHPPDLAAASSSSPSSGEASGMPRPVIIHRAVLGSLERFIAILTEHTAGKWPLWLSPRQCAVLPISKDQIGYAAKVRDALCDEGFYADVDESDNTISKKIRESQLSQYNYILVVGKDEQAKATVNVRTRDNVVHGERDLGALIKDMRDEIDSFK